MTSLTDRPFQKGGVDYHHEDTHLNGTDHGANGSPKVNNKHNLDKESSDEQARRPRQNSRIPIANLLCSVEATPHSEDRSSLPGPETLPPIRSRHQYAYDGWDLPPRQPSSSSSSTSSMSAPQDSHHYKFGQPYSYRQSHQRSLVAIHEDDTSNNTHSPSYPKDYHESKMPGETRRPSATYHDSFQPRHDPYPLAQSPFDHSKIKSFRDGDRTFAPTPMRRDSGLGPSQPPFATPPHPPNRSASLSDAYQESCHPYDQEHKARTDRAKSDFALHQQNYGPYLDASPPLASATLFSPTNTNANTNANNTKHEKNAPSSSRYDAPAPPPLALAYDQRHLPSSSSSHTPSPREYIPQPHRSFQGEAIHPDHGPMTPSSPNYCATERNSAPRIYGIDAADTPRPPPSYNTKSPYALQHAPDEFSLSDTSRRHSMGQMGSNYHRPSAARDPRFLDYTSGREYAPQPRYEHTWSPSMTHPPSYSPPSEPYIQPPSWYQSYAHASKAHSGDRAWFPEHIDPRPPLTSRRGSEHGHLHNNGSWAPSQVSGPPHGYGMEHPEARRDYGHEGARPSRPSLSHSVHPFDAAPVSPPSNHHRPQVASPTKPSNKRAQEDDPFIVEDGIKAKRKRANASQLSVLNAAFEKSYFPSTEERLRLSRECKMCPRTVQIWFQNKRQSVKARPEALDAAMMASQNGSGRRSSMMDMRRRASESGPAVVRAREERQRAVTTATTTGLGIKRLLDEKEEERREREKKEDVSLPQPEPVNNHHHHHHHHNNYNNNNNNSSSSSSSSSSNGNGGPVMALDGDQFPRKRRATIAKME
ncbi:hypothetical protein MVEG_00527 [Podila verticillata NRRL 6337]|nr:hypothetical protein MVEG_00527 [Podila verticillata NRRL 6337]